MEITPQQRSGNPLKIAILQRVCTSYRAGLFRQLSTNDDLQVKLIIGEDVPNTKIRSTADLSGIDYLKLPTRLFNLKNRTLVWHSGLVKTLENFQPDVIVCEGESHVLGFIQAIRYRRKYPNTKLIHWGGGGLPGHQVNASSLKSRLLRRLQRFADAFIVYSSFCRNWLIELGHSPADVHVATNVGLTASHVRAAEEMQLSTSEARKKLGLPDNFTVLYVGTLDANKRPDVLLDLAAATNSSEYNYVLAGNGSIENDLKSRASSDKLTNVFLPGNVGQDLNNYYRAADVLIIPGRGGIVISEAMAWEIPVVVHEADGTEYDLVQDQITGRHLRTGSVQDFQTVIESMKNSQDQTKKMGENGRQLLIDKFSMDHMIDQFVNVAFEVAEPN